MLIEQTTYDGKPAYTTTLPRTAESARDARGLASSALGLWGLGEIEDPAWLIITELVSNAVTHARRDSIRVTVTREDFLVVRLAVTDLSRTLPAVRQTGGQEECGRGLAIVDAMTGGRWGSILRRWGKTVWAEIDATGKVET
ncbi:ATP-binding protein [Streptomyces atroolivaceus]|uniref:ATP-binding protein n=1 Tax=Streptomyces atroolivaceus TaxID=66869 RepID=UPI00365F8417